ncbi:penicillin-binding protein 1C [Amorphus orientalis]|uniref:peptidoglycan glycosyltransferase n=1 Tax=Amorphus orientalis TaxID=649198 RepID=A0AAE3VS02_9HYPH|nr:penicillin-binding protein 1C [Amorphus orientalis]MDQ0317107.1 penicillin-binding protein 1C [Amorphus orientalis]
MTSPPRPTGRRKWLRRFAIAGAAACVIVLGAGAVGLYELDRRHPPTLEPEGRPSVMVVDRDGALLRPFTTETGRWRLPVAVDEVDDRYLQLLMAYEDGRFRQHFGVDPRAMVRAAWQAVTSGEIVSGGSTLTMQTVRLLENRHERTLSRKLLEMARAVQLERRLTKDEILTRYLQLAPFGGNLEGVRAASLAYFGREPSRLTLGQAALLVALPQAPESRRPDRYPERARAARDRVLDRVAGEGAISQAEADAAKHERVPTARRPVPMHAPHLARRLVTADPASDIHRTTLDGRLQSELETLVRERVEQLGPYLSTAILVVDHHSGEIVAHVGSADFLSVPRQGHIDMTRAIRSPGSTLKPFIYGLAFEAGIAHPETLVEDRPTRFGDYRPENFDDEFHGTVTVREALSQSLNVPAVAVLDVVGANRLAIRLRDAGVPLKLPRIEAPSLAIGLGGVGLTLEGLTHLYTALARGGDPIALSASPEPGGAGDAKPLPGARLFDRSSAWQVANVLSDTPPPQNARGGSIAYKTGTSYGYRDAWSVGFDGRHVVAVWVGRPDSAPVPGLTGRTAAAPLLFDAFARISPARTPLPGPPRGTLRASTGELPEPLRRFRNPRAPDAEPGRAPLSIAYPPDGATISLAAPDGSRQPLSVKVDGAVSRLVWLVDGRPIRVAPHRRTASIPVERAGPVRITVLDTEGSSDSVSVRVE